MAEKDEILEQVEEQTAVSSGVVEYFDPDEIQRVKKQRKIILGIFFAVLGVYLAFSAGMLAWYLTLPYKSPKITVVKAIHYSVSGLFIIFLFIYMGIVFKRVNKFYKVCVHLATGIRETYTGSFLEYDETLEVKDGVDYKSLVFIEWNKYKNDFFERKVLVFDEKPFPEIPEKANVRFVTQGNVLINYEIL